MTASTAIRLQSFLASAGLGSRRGCEEFIAAGRVTVDGKTVLQMGTTVDPDQQVVAVDGERIRTRRRRYLLLNKPVGYLCTNRDPQGRPRAIDLVPAREHEHLFTVGRLDESSQGLLLVTNDGELANRLAHPRYEVIRTYRVQVAGIPDRETLNELRNGLRFDEGHFRVRSARRLKTVGKSAFLQIEMSEGRNREIRRLFARVGHKVLRLERVGFGPLRLGKLPPGTFRELRGSELTELLEFAKHPGRGSERRRTPRPAAGGRRRKPATAGTERGRKPAGRGAKSGTAKSSRSQPRRGR